MAYGLHATRERPMNERQGQRLDELIVRYHLGGQSIRHPGYDQHEDGSHTEVCIIVEDRERDLAAAEFRCAGFVVTIEPLSEVVSLVK